MWNRNDYSMGYADQYGFRAGTCTPFYFYDLKSESKTSLKIHPFAYMEGVLKDYYAMDTKEATNSINQLKEAVQKVNGVFTYLAQYQVIKIDGKGGEVYLNHHGCNLNHHILNVIIT